MSAGKKTIDLGLMLLLFAAPLIRARQFVFDNVFFSKELFIQFAAALVFIVFLLKLGSDDKARPAFTPLDLPLTVYLAVSVAAAFFAPAGYLALLAVVMLTALFFVFFTVSRHAESLKQVESYFTAVAASSLVVSAYGLWQVGARLGGFEDLRLVSFKNIAETTLGGANLTAQFLMMALFPCAALVFLKPPAKRLLALGAAGVVFILFLFTLSRGAYIGLFIGFIVSAALAFSLRKSLFDAADAKWLKAAAVVCAVVMVVFGAFSLAVLRKDIAASEAPTSAAANETGGDLQSSTYGLASIFDQTAVSLRLRTSWWRDAARIIRDNFLIGVGPGNFEVVHFRYRSVSESDIQARSRVTSPHSDFLHVMSETGVAGASAFTVIMVVIFKRIAEKAKTLGRGEALACIGIAGALTSTLAQGVMDFNLHNPVPALNFWFFSGLLFSPAFEKQGQAPPEKQGLATPFFGGACTRFSETARYSLLIAATLMALFSAMTFIHETHVVKGLRLASEGNFGEAKAEYGKAIALSPWDFKTYVFLGRLYEKIGDYPAAARFMEEGIGRYPNYYSFIENLGEIHFKNGNYGEAEKRYREAMAIYPGYSQPHYDLAFLYEETGRAPLAPGEAEKGFSLSAKGAWDWNMLGAAYLKRGRHADALEKLGVAREMAPDDPYILYNYSYAGFYAGSEKEAVSALRRAIMLKPDEPEFHRLMRRFSGDPH